MTIKKKILEMILIMEKDFIENSGFYENYIEILLFHIQKISSAILHNNEEFKEDFENADALIRLSEKMDFIIQKSNFINIKIETKEGIQVPSSSQKAIKKSKIESVAMSEKIRDTLLLSFHIDPSNVEEEIEKLLQELSEKKEVKEIKPSELKRKKSTLSPEMRFKIYISMIIIGVPMLSGLAIMYMLLGKNFIDVASGEMIFVAWIIGYEIMSFITGLFFIKKIVFK